MGSDHADCCSFSWGAGNLLVCNLRRICWGLGVMNFRIQFMALAILTIAASAGASAQEAEGYVPPDEFIELSEDAANLAENQPDAEVDDNDVSIMPPTVEEAEKVVPAFIGYTEDREEEAPTTCTGEDCSFNNSDIRTPDTIIVTVPELAEPTYPAEVEWDEDRFTSPYEARGVAPACGVEPEIICVDLDNNDSDACAQRVAAWQTECRAWQSDARPATGSRASCHQACDLMSSTGTINHWLQRHATFVLGRRYDNFIMQLDRLALVMEDDVFEDHTDIDAWFADRHGLINGGNGYPNPNAVCTEPQANADTASCHQACNIAPEGGAGPTGTCIPYWMLALATSVEGEDMFNVEHLYEGLLDASEVDLAIAPEECTQSGNEDATCAPVDGLDVEEPENDVCDEDGADGTCVPEDGFDFVGGDSYCDELPGSSSCLPDGADDTPLQPYCEDGDDADTCEPLEFELGGFEDFEVIIEPPFYPEPEGTCSDERHAQLVAELEEHRRRLAEINEQLAAQHVERQQLIDERIANEAQLEATDLQLRRLRLVFDGVSHPPPDETAEEISNRNALMARLRRDIEAAERNRSIYRSRVGLMLRMTGQLSAKSNLYRQSQVFTSGYMHRAHNNLDHFEDACY